MQAGGSGNAGLANTALAAEEKDTHAFIVAGASQDAARWSPQTCRIYEEHVD